MKKRFIIILSALALLLSGCTQPQSDKKKLQVVAAIFPEYDWVRQIVGDDDSVELTLLVDDGVDPHSFQPAVSDMVTAANCDLLIYGGGESDQWLTKLEATNPNRETLVAAAPIGCAGSPGGSGGGHGSSRGSRAGKRCRNGRARLALPAQCAFLLSGHHRRTV